MIDLKELEKKYNLKELEEKYEELGKEIERLKKEQETVGFKDDPIFLLSKEEYEKYRDKIPGTCVWWWLRSSGYYSGLTAGVYSDGSVDHNGDLANCCIGAVRPALKISDYYSRRGKVVFNGVTWVKIDKDLYISELPIDFRKFGGESNNYATSEIRKFLLDWFEERQELN